MGLGPPTFTPPTSTGIVFLRWGPLMSPTITFAVVRHDAAYAILAASKFSGRNRTSPLPRCHRTAARRTRSFVHGSLCTHCARVAELADALDLGSRGATRGGSTPPSRTRPGSRDEG